MDYFFIVKNVHIINVLRMKSVNVCLNEWIPEKIQGPKRTKPCPIQKIKCLLWKLQTVKTAYRCDKIQTFWGTIETCHNLLKMRSIKKFPEHVQRKKGEGVKTVWLKSKVKLLFSTGCFPKTLWPARLEKSGKANLN